MSMHTAISPLYSKIMPKNTRSLTLSLGIVAVALGLAYAPTPVAQQTVVVVSGSELQEPLVELERRLKLSIRLLQ